MGRGYMSKMCAVGINRFNEIFSHNENKDLKHPTPNTALVFSSAFTIVLFKCVGGTDMVGGFALLYFSGIRWASENEKMIFLSNHLIPHDKNRGPYEKSP